MFLVGFCEGDVVGYEVGVGFLVGEIDGVIVLVLHLLFFFV